MHGHLNVREPFSVHYVSGALTELQKAITNIFIAVRLSLRLSASNSPSIGCIFMKFDILAFSINLSIKFKFDYSQSRMTCSLQEALCKFVMISHEILLRTRNLSDKRCRGSQTHVL